MRFWVPTCIPKLIKIHQKRMPRSHPSWASIFGRSLIDFWCQLRPLDPQESSPRCSESTIYQKIVFRNLYQFFFDFGANMPSFSFQKSINNASKLRLGRHHFFDWFLHRFFIDFPSIWVANLELCWALRHAQDASKTLPRRLPQGSQDEARDIFSLQRWFWSIWGWFIIDLSVDFWLILGVTIC